MTMIKLFMLLAYIMKKKTDELNIFFNMKFKKKLQKCASGKTKDEVE